MANEVNKQIEARIQAFAKELNELVREAALEAVQDVLGGASKAGRATTASRVPAKRRPATPSGRLSSRQMAGAIEAVRNFIASNPGARMEQMTAALGQPAARLRGPVNKLIEQGQVRKTGEKRTTQYYPAAGRKGSRSGRSPSRKR